MNTFRSSEMDTTELSSSPSSQPTRTNTAAGSLPTVPTPASAQTQQNLPPHILGNNAQQVNFLPQQWINYGQVPHHAFVDVHATLLRQAQFQAVFNGANAAPSLGPMDELNRLRAENVQLRQYMMQMAHCLKIWGETVYFNIPRDGAPAYFYPNFANVAPQSEEAAQNLNNE